MSLSYFYIKQFDPSQQEIELDEDASYHIVHVLRMKPEQKLQLTDGKGNLIMGHILSSHKKHCIIKVEETTYKEQGSGKISIAISLVKNVARFEWFLEKATEIGINEFIPLICERTIQQKFRYERMKGICISAMLQSQQCWLPVLHEPIAFDLLFRQEELKNTDQKFIAYCDERPEDQLSDHIRNKGADDGSVMILIGPAGDFSPKEIELAQQHEFTSVSLGETRLRTETAGVVAASLLKSL